MSRRRPRHLAERPGTLPGDLQERLDAVMRGPAGAALLLDAGPDPALGHRWAPTD
ncbi:MULTISPECIES: hypothetical protein [unclassified Streptomyces]|uniref:hypothetical protein n=1 Tax=unclassified Streptomyces TaxID=2593676 RepID=UPI003661324F